jgi:hypothetical protein
MEAKVNLSFQIEIEHDIYSFESLEAFKKEVKQSVKVFKEEEFLLRLRDLVTSFIGFDLDEFTDISAVKIGNVLFPENG